MSVYIAPHGPRPWVAKFGPGPIESLAMMLGHFVDNSEQFVGNPKRNKFPPPRGFHVEGGSWKLSGSSNSSATYSFRRQAHNAPHKPQQPRKHTPPNRRPEATMQGGNILTISAFYLIGGIAPSLGGAGCLSMPQFLVVLSLRKPMRLGVTTASVDILVCAEQGG